MTVKKSDFDEEKALSLLLALSPDELNSLLNECLSEYLGSRECFLGIIRGWVPDDWNVVRDTMAGDARFLKSMIESGHTLFVWSKFPGDDFAYVHMGICHEDDRIYGPRLSTIMDTYYERKRKNGEKR